jgi:hypothetical protein
VDAHQDLDYLNHALRIVHSNHPVKTDAECIALFHAQWPDTGMGRSVGEV